MGVYSLHPNGAFSLEILNQIMSTQYVVSGPPLQAIFLALMKIVQKVGNKWRAYFQLCSQHYLIHFYCVLRFILYLYVFLCVTAFHLVVSLLSFPAFW